MVCDIPTGMHQPGDADESVRSQAHKSDWLMIWIERNLSADLSLTALARKGAMSVRTLSRNFRAQVGMTPAEWIARARVRRAQRLLETTRHFAAIVGTSPMGYRRAFSPSSAILAKR